MDALGDQQHNANQSFRSLGSFSQLPETSIYHVKRLILFIRGFCYVTDGRIICKNCGFSFAADDTTTFDKQMWKHLAYALKHRVDPCLAPWFSNNSNMWEYISTTSSSNDDYNNNNPNNDRRQQTEDPPSAVEVYEDENNNYVESDELSNQAEVEESTSHSEARQLSNHGGSTDDVITRGQPLAFSSLCEKFNKTQLFVLESLGLTTYDDDVICKKCKYKLWWKIPFCKIITSHYAMYPKCEALGWSTKSDTGEFDARCYLAKTLARCLPTYTSFINMSNNYNQSPPYEYDNNISQSSSATPSDQSRSSSVFNLSNSVIINQSRAIALAGCGFSFDKICDNFYCDRCKIVASKDLSLSNVCNILGWHAEKDRFCSFIVGLKNLDKNENVDNDGMLVFKGYEDYLMDVTTVDYDSSRYER